MRGIWVTSLIVGFIVSGSSLKAQTPRSATVPAPRDPYLGALVVDARNGRVLWEDKPDTPCHPASVIKLMDLLILLEKVGQGTLKMDEPIQVTAEASKIGGSQVYLKEGEIFTVEELTYAMMIQSANDAAATLAIHIAGSKEGFIELMNKKAAELGMNSTRFASVHGLPPGPGQAADITTPRDLALLARNLLKQPDALKFTSVMERGFRNGEFTMRNHNPLLTQYPGCDGLKTGYTRSGGYGIVATAERKGVRVIAVVMGSKDRLVRNQQAGTLLSKGFQLAPPAPPPPPPAPILPEAPPAPPAPAPEPHRSFAWLWLVLIGVGLIAGIGLGYVFASRRR
jgi:D-alanyl-D-alanine carboxypeptidase (penicillin-binding protein 5/6)